MKIGHLADLHLGYAAYYKTAPSGANQRSVDVAIAFRSAVDAILAAKPDIIVVAGDVFDMPKPSNTAILFAFEQFERFRDAGIPVVIIAGNHDSPRTAETGSILRLFEKCGADVAWTEARQFVYPELGLRVTAAPHQAVMMGEIPMPGEERYQVLVAHAEMQGGYGGERPCGQIPAEVLGASWSAICLGDYHIAHEVAPMAWYPGSLEFTSSNPWAELGTPKGWLLWDLNAGTVEPQSIPLARRFYDLESVNAADLESAQVDALIAERLSQVEIEGAVARLKVINCPRPVSRGLNHAAIRKLKGQALHLQIEYEQPEVITVGGEREVRLHETIEEKVDRHLGKFSLAPGLSRERFVEIGRDVMAEARAVEEARQAKRGAA